jgi:hypothetical protein
VEGQKEKLPRLAVAEEVVLAAAEADIHHKRRIGRMKQRSSAVDSQPGRRRWLSAHMGLKSAVMGLPGLPERLGRMATERCELG